MLLSSRTHFTKIEDKNVIAKNYQLEFKWSYFRISASVRKDTSLVSGSELSTVHAYRWINHPITWLLHKYSKTCVNRPLSKRRKMVFMPDHCFMQVKSIAAFCNTFDGHLATNCH